MRLTTVFLIASLLQVSAAGLAQQVTLKRQNAKLTSIFDEIRQQTGYDFVYNDKMIDQAKPVTIQVTAMALNEVLTKIFENQPLNFDIQEKTIVVKEKLPSFLDKTKTVLDLFQRHDASGRVVNDNGDPLAGASVTVKGTNRSTKTNERGIFFLSGLKENDVLVISFIGFESLEIGVKAAEKGDIRLKEIVGQLDEVRLIGYGTTTQRLATGNTSRITAADIEKQPVTNPLQTLQGRMPGVLVTNGQGLPGTETKIQIRGINSIQGNRDPLYIVDGVPFSATALYGRNAFSSPLTDFQNAGSGPSFTPFNSLAPSDIESIDVLKDADATAIYGARGANGVVLITTKKGKLGSTTLDFNVNSALQKVGRFMKGLLSTQEYLALEKEGAKNDAYPIDQDKDNYPELFLWDQNKTTDWQKLIIGNTGHITNVTGTISGGNAGTTFLLGGNYHKEGTIYPGDLSYNRGGAHLNVNHNSQDGRFITMTTVNYSSDRNALIMSGIPVFNTPNFPLYKNNSQLNFDGGYNYLAILKRRSTTKIDNILANAIIGYQITKDLNFKTGFGFNRISLNGFSFIPLVSLDPADNPVNSATYANQTSTTQNLEPLLDYKKMTSLGKIMVLIGGTYQSTFSQGNFVSGENYKDENLFESLGAAGRIRTYPAPATTYTQYKYISVFGRVNYNIKDKYILNINYRRDGSSRFGPGKQFGNFSSVGGAWTFSNEEFLKKSFSFLSYGKLRASYGSVGNQPSNDYQFLQTYQSSSSYQGDPGLIPSRIANPDFRWEVNKKLEVGIDLGLINDRILLTTAWFKNRTNNQLLSTNLPSQTGFSSYLSNLPAVVDNVGLEASLSTQNLKCESFSWSTSINISCIDNKLVSFPTLNGSRYQDLYEIGQSLSIIKKFIFAGVDPQTGDALYYNKENKNTNKPIYSVDYKTIGKTIPDYYGGISNNLKFKGLELDFLIQFVKQDGYRPAFSPGFSPSIFVESFMQEETLKRWQKQGDITNVPKASLTNYNTNYMYSSYFFGDASYIKLKNLSLTYLFPVSWTNKVKIAQCKIYIQGQNLFTITKYKGSDPEIPSSGLIVPTLKVISAGLQITL